MNCNQINTLLGAYHDHELSDGDRARVEEHLAGCEACRAELAELRRTTELVASLPRHEAPPVVGERVRADVRRTASARRRATAWRWLSVGGWIAAAATLLIVLRTAGWDPRLSPHPPTPSGLPRHSAEGSEHQAREEREMAKNDGASEGWVSPAGAPVDKARKRAAKPLGGHLAGKKAVGSEERDQGAAEWRGNDQANAESLARRMRAKGGRGDAELALRSGASRPAKSDSGGAKDRSSGGCPGPGGAGEQAPREPEPLTRPTAPPGAPPQRQASTGSDFAEKARGTASRHFGALAKAEGKAARIITVEFASRDSGLKFLRERAARHGASITEVRTKQQDDASLRLIADALDQEQTEASAFALRLPRGGAAKLLAELEPKRAKTKKQAGPAPARETGPPQAAAAATQDGRRAKGADANVVRRDEATIQAPPADAVAGYGGDKLDAKHAVLREDKDEKQGGSVTVWVILRVTQPSGAGD
jgi:hypothetical protein